MRTPLAFLAGLSLGAWGGAEFMESRHHQTDERRGAQIQPAKSGIDSLAQTLPSGFRAISGMDVARLMGQTQPAEWRTWTDDTGRSVKARFVNRTTLSVTLLTENNNKATWPIDQLSLQDRAWLSMYHPPQ